MPVCYNRFCYVPLPKQLTYSNQTGDDVETERKTGEKALNGELEERITVRFAPVADEDRKIWFQGGHISVLKEETRHCMLLLKDVPLLGAYKVPAGYTCYIRTGDVYFEQTE